MWFPDEVQRLHALGELLDRWVLRWVSRFMPPAQCSDARPHPSAC
jgi:hypothetical protein